MPSYFRFFLLWRKFTIYGFILKLNTNLQFIKQNHMQFMIVPLFSSLPASLIVSCFNRSVAENCKLCQNRSTSRWQMETLEDLCLCTSSAGGEGEKQRENEYNILCKFRHFGKLFWLSSFALEKEMLLWSLTQNWAGKIHCKLCFYI